MGYRIVCIGDSNTTGHGLKQQAFPQQLERVLKDRCETLHVSCRHSVLNCGKSGVTISGYTKTKKFRQAKSFKADYYIVMLGTNDAWHKEGDVSAIEKPLGDLLSQLKPKPILMIIPPGQFKKGRTAKKNPTVIDAIKKGAQKYGTALLDPPFDLSHYRADRIHLNAEGAKFLAETVADHMLMNIDEMFCIL